MSNYSASMKFAFAVFGLFDETVASKVFSFPWCSKVSGEDRNSRFASNPSVATYFTSSFSAGVFE